MSWFRRKPPAPEIPKFEPPVMVEARPRPKDDGIVVEEIDTSAMTQTGVHRAWDRLTGRLKGDN